MKIDTCQS